jgi:hypothetical protein
MATQTRIERPPPREERLPPPGDPYDRIRCRDCGRTYPALDGPALLYSLKAACPCCGGGFQLEL